MYWLTTASSGRLTAAADVHVLAGRKDTHMSIISLRAAARLIMLVCGALLLVGCQTTGLPPRTAGYVQGVWKEKQSGAPIANETIMLAKFTVAGKQVRFSAQDIITATTDATGAFRFDNVPRNTLLFLTAVDDTGSAVTIFLSYDAEGRDVGVVYGMED